MRATTEVEFYGTWNSQPTLAHMLQCWPRAGGRVAMTYYYSDASVGLSAGHLEHLIYFDPKFVLAAQLPTQNWIKI